jgi:hypothetical protein
LNFFQRRRILKRVNSLDLTPIRLMESKLKEDGKVDILLPRFKNHILRRSLQPHWKQEYILIHLDEMGSSIWNEIDGVINVHEICIRLKTSHPEKLKPIEETETRVSQFLSMLYQQRYITFREITSEI